MRVFQRQIEVCNHRTAQYCRLGLLRMLAVMGIFVVGAALAGEKGMLKNDDLRKLDGRWRLVSVEQNELTTILDENAEVIFTIRRGELFLQDNKVGSLSFPETEAIVKPKLVDVQLGDQGTVEGIYDLDGDTWRVCINNASQGDSKERPTEFSSRGSPTYQLFVFQREKD